jgi:hypothetical protein
MSEPEKSNALWRRWLSRLGLALLLVLSFVARTHNREDVFHGGEVYFLEGDCYSRMTRAKMVAQGELVIRHHDFENWPAGTTPHTTAPLDWIIAGSRFFARPFSGGIEHRDLELAGAWISPLLGVFTALWLWWWAGRMRLPFRGVMVLFFALCPILVHGTLLGRPDHQSLLILLLAVAFGAEVALADSRRGARSARKWSIVAGVAWGLSLWVSLYEPAVCFALAMLWHAFAGRMALLAKAVRPRWIALGSVVVLALLIDGWRVTLPGEELRERLMAWSRTIGELKPLSLSGSLPWYWFGAFWVSAPFLLGLAWREDRRSLGLLAVVAVLICLTFWQRRWGYFSSLAVAMSIPWQLGALRYSWAGWIAGLAALLPLGKEWRERLHPPLDIRERREETQAQNRAVQAELRRLALLMRSDEKRPFLAVWWHSPQLAYWSGQPGVAGTSHQSFPGIYDSARFFLSDDAGEEVRILRERGVRYLVVHDLAVQNDPRKYPSVINSAAITGTDAPLEPLGFRLADSPRKTPPWLRFVPPEERGLVLGIGRREAGTVTATDMKFYVPQFLQIYEVLPEQFPK